MDVDDPVFVCRACRQERPRNPRLKPGRQEYCSFPDCQRVASKTRQQRRLANDAEYRKSQDEAKESWRENNSGYWQKYRKSHPEVVRRNRLLQRLRDFRRRGKGRIGSNKGHKVSLENSCTQGSDSVVVPNEIPPGDYVMKRVHPGSPVYLLAHVDVVAVVGHESGSTISSAKRCLQG